MVENGVQRVISVPERDEVAGECRKACNEVLHDWYCSPNIVRFTK